MADPQVALTQAFQRALEKAFGPEYSEFDPAIRSSQHADYQVNVAMSLKARVGKPPRDIAAAIVAALDAPDLVERAEIAGPGFVNITLKGSFLEAELAAASANARLGLPSPPAEVVVIDYSSPNVAKEMHVGHIRSTIIGDAIARVLEALGHRVIRQNHLGDWGTPFGMLIEHLLDEGEDAADSSMSELKDFYQAARKKFDSDPAFADRARRRVVSLQAGEPATLSLWKLLVDATLRYTGSLYDKLGVTLKDADVAGESSYNPVLADVIRELTEKGMVVESDGALCIFLDGFEGRDGARVPLIVQKQDGGYGYATTDLAAIRHRLGTLGARRVIVVVGQEQSQHLAMIFEAARVAGWLVPPARAQHVSFGLVLGPDGKKLGTRAGGSVRLADLIEQAVDRARVEVKKKNPDLAAALQEDVARMVGVGAIKYADLSSDRVKAYTFDLERMVAFEGNTAGYVQYAHARCRSIFRKGGEADVDASAITLGAPAERALALTLLRFSTAVSHVADALEPHVLCTYLYELASSFSTFYIACPVLKAETPELKRSRLALTGVTARMLARGLGLLGIEAPDEM
jgi:arginyl-tRNA synthetase